MKIPYIGDRQDELEYSMLVDPDTCEVLECFLPVDRVCKECGDAFYVRSAAIWELWCPKCRDKV